MTGPIVVGYDGSPASRAAIRWAATEAERRETTLRVVHAPAWPIGGESSGAAVLRRLGRVHAKSERLLQGASREILPDHQGLRIELEAVAGDTVPVLLQEATDAVLLVVGAHGRRDAGDRAAVSVRAHLAAHAPCPVVVVPEDWTPCGTPEVVVGVDGSAASATAIRFAIDHAERVGAHVTVVLAWHDPQYDGSGDLPPVILDPPAPDGAEPAGDSPAERSSNVEVSEMLVHRPPADALLDAARNAQLLVVGSAGPGRFAGLRLGSVSRTVLRLSSCPVAVVRPVVAMGPTRP